MTKIKKKFRDRKDSKLCTDISGLNQILIDLKPKRSMSEVYINEKIDVTKFVEYIKKQKENNNDITYFHGFMMAIGKLLYNRPLLNRFISNRHVYEHDNVSISYVMKIAFDDKSEEIMVIMPINENENIYSLSNKIHKKVSNVRKKSDKGRGANDAIQILGKLPNILRVPLVGGFKLLDKWGLLPLSLVQDNIYYSSIIVSNVGTLKCNGIYHNVTDFGTCSGIITIGEIKEVELKEKGKKKIKYFCEMGVTIDERVADGFYMIKSLKLMEYILNNPELLEGRADEKIEIE